MMKWKSDELLQLVTSGAWAHGGASVYSFGKESRRTVVVAVEPQFPAQGRLIKMLCVQVKTCLPHLGMKSCMKASTVQINRPVW